MTDLRFPIGEFTMPDAVSAAERSSAVDAIAEHPERLKQAVDWLTDDQLDTPYRPDGWTPRQVVHHLPDSHMNAFIRMKLALTEDEPLIRTYEEARWAKLPDATLPITVSLNLLAALHVRWVALCRALSEDQWMARFKHPELGVMSVAQLSRFYAWHGKHHVAHITSLCKRKGWAKS